VTSCPNDHEVDREDRFCGQCGVPLVDLSPDEIHAHVEALADAARRHAAEGHPHRCPYCSRDTRLAGHVVSKVADVDIVQCPDYPANREPMLMSPGRSAT
jgi:uncharacterized protein with PIN domain